MNAVSCDADVLTIGAGPAGASSAALMAGSLGRRPLVLAADDLRSAQYQRVTTAQGSGAEAVLSLYYEGARAA